MSTILIESVSQGTELDEPGDGSMAHAFITKKHQRYIPFWNELCHALCLQADNGLGSLTNSIRGIATSRVESTDSK